MATIKLNYIGELRCENTHVKTGSGLITDAPVDNCGKGSTYSPTDLLTTALLSCMVTVMGIRANEKNWELKDLKGSALKKMGIGPRRVVGVDIEISLNGNNLSPTMREELEQVALGCPVAKSLSAELLQAVNFTYTD